MRRVGGLADTVADASDAALQDGTATGFVFDEATPSALAATIERAAALYRRPDDRRRVMLQAMAQDCGWSGPAGQYLALYREAMAARRAAPRGAPPAG